MITVLLVIHLMIAAGLVGVVLLQRSEGGALGIGGGSGAGGGFLTGRGTANLLTRTTAALAAGFFLTSILLTILGRGAVPTGSVFDGAAGTAGGAPASQSSGEGGQAPSTGRGGILDKLQPAAPSGPVVPQSN